MGDEDWSATQTKPLLGIVVLNPASGPGYTTTHIDGADRDQYQNRMAEFVKANEASGSLGG